MMKNLIVVLALFSIIMLSGCLEEESSSSLGTLEISSNPSDAQVYIDGNLVGNTPLSLELGLATYEVKLVREGYQDSVRTVLVGSEEKSVLNVDLIEEGEKQRYGNLEIRTSPNDAKIYLNDEFKGESNLVLDGLEVGVYLVKIEKLGYKNYSSSVEINDGQTELISLVLEEDVKNNTTTGGKGNIRIFSDPVGANVYINDKFEGQSPVEVKNLDAGTYQVRVSKNEYSSFNGYFEVKGGQVTTVNADLLSSDYTGNLNVDSSPRGAKIYIDDEYVGETFWQGGAFNSGSHKIKVTKDGYYDYETTVNIVAGQLKLLNVILAKDTRDDSFLNEKD